MSPEKAKQELDDAITHVAQSAQMLVDGASQLTKNEYDEFAYIVDSEDLDDLKEACKVWKEKTENFLKEVQKAGG